WDAIELANHALLDSRGEPGNAAAGDAGLSAELVRVSDELDDGPKCHRHAVVAKRPLTPHVPAAAIVGQVAVSDRDKLPRRRRAAGQCEHQHSRVAQQSASVAALDLFDVWVNVLVGCNWHLPAKIGRGLHSREAVVTAKLRSGLQREDLPEESFLRLTGVQ